MPISIGSIQLGSKRKKSFFDKTHDVNTTTDFGFCQPTILDDRIIADSNLTIKTNNFIRLAPLPVPTFGRIELKTFNAFVPYKDVFLAYDYLQAQKSVTSALGSYIPTTADYVGNYELLSSIIGETDYWVSRNNIRNYEYQHIYNTYAMFFSIPDFESFTFLVGSDSYTVKIKGGSCKLFDLAQNPITEIINKPSGDITLGNGGLWLELSKQIINAYLPQLRNSRNSIFGNLNNHRFTTSFPYFMFSNVNNYIINGVTFDSDYRRFNGLTQSQLIGLDNSCTLETCDYKIPIKVGTAVKINNQSVINQNQLIFIGIKLTKQGKRLFKIFNANHTFFKYKDEKVSLIPLLSYYKSWFDRFNPGRNMQWLDTNAYKLIHGFYDDNYTVHDMLQDIDADTGKPHSYVAFLDFLYDLTQCCYTLPIDALTVATANPIGDNVNMASYNEFTIHPSESDSFYIDTDETTRYGAYNSNSGALGIKLLDRFMPLINKDTVIGSKISDYLRTKFGYSLPETNYIGETKTMVNVDDITATVNNDQSLLGEYAGTGKAGQSCQEFKFSTKYAGTFVQYICVVPLGGYVQTSKRPLLGRYDFYQPEFDSLGMEPMSYSQVNGRSSVLNAHSYSTTFGFVPRYFTDFKTYHNLANGGFAFNSESASFLPYSLDRIFSEDTASLDIVGGVQKPQSIAPDEILRFVGNDDNFGNYNRIFYDTTGVTDNFIVHLINEYKVWAPMLPTGQSWQTYDPEVDDSTTNVEHA